VINVRADDSGEPQLCPCPPQEEPASTGSSGADAPNPAPDTVGTGDGTEQDELSGNVASRIGTGVGSASARASRALASTNIIDLTASADKSLRKGTRDPKAVYALVLHQMACCFAPKDPLKRFLSVGAHFAITNDGRILQLHPVSALVWASNGFNNRSVAVEFAGNFPSTKGRWWKAETYGMNRLTAAQVTAGRQLIQHLVQTIGLTHVLAHRQSSGTRENDPGPDVWFDVGQWAVNNLGLKDGGPGFKIGTGTPIPDEWRTWGSRRPAVTPQREVDDDAAMPETEIVHDEWDSEYVPASGDESIRHNRHCGCRRCTSVGAGSLGAESFEDGGGAGPAAGGVVQHGRWIRRGREVVLLGG
jgi:hypothetical protein